MDISAVICTYNRCKSLQGTLDSLLHQEMCDNFEYEVIVVDNNSNDNTRDIVTGFIPKFNGKLKYVFESNQGLSNARNRGICEATGEIIIFTDDDCLPEKEWFSKINIVFSKNKSIDLMLGGAIWEDAKRIYTELNPLRGNGLHMAFRKNTLFQLGLFDKYLGAGSIGCSADDTEIMYRAIKNKKNIEIHDDILVVHKHRISSQEQLKFAYRDSKGYVIFWLKYVIRDKDLFALKNIYWYFLRTFICLLQSAKSYSKFNFKLRGLQLVGGIVGIFKGLFIWIFLKPIETICQKSA